MPYFTGAKGNNKFALRVVTIVKKEKKKNAKILLVFLIGFFTFQTLYPMNFDSWVTPVVFAAITVWMPLASFLLLLICFFV